MPFNENQYFYAALWWTAALPGGAEHIGDICDMHDLGRPDFSACPPPVSDLPPVPASKAGMFFSSLYYALGAAEEQRIELSAADESGPLGFALAHTRLSPDFLPAKPRMTLDNDGRILMQGTVLLRYAGMPFLSEKKHSKPQP